MLDYKNPSEDPSLNPDFLAIKQSILKLKPTSERYHSELVNLIAQFIIGYRNLTDAEKQNPIFIKEYFRFFFGEIRVHMFEVCKSETQTVSKMNFLDTVFNELGELNEIVVDIDILYQLRTYFTAIDNELRKDSEEITGFEIIPDLIDKVIEKQVDAMSGSAKSKGF